MFVWTPISPWILNVIIDEKECHADKSLLYHKMCGQTYWSKAKLGQEYVCPDSHFALDMDFEITLHICKHWWDEVSHRRITFTLKSVISLRGWRSKHVIIIFVWTLILAMNGYFLYNLSQKLPFWDWVSRRKI